MIYLIKNNIIAISGDRNTDNYLTIETAHIRFTPLFEPIFSAKMHGENGNLTEIMLQFKKQKYFEILLEWEQFRYTLNELDKSTKIDIKNDDNKIADIRIKILAAIECLELDMQLTPYLLNSSSCRISIRNPQVINLERKKPLNPIDEAYSILEKMKNIE